MDSIAIVHCSNRCWPVVRVATSFLQKLRGLLFRNELSVDSGLLLKRCNSIHTCGMRFPIDVVFINQHWQVTSTVSQLKPFRTTSDIHASMVLELRAGSVTTAGIVIGDQLLLESAP